MNLSHFRIALLSFILLSFTVVYSQKDVSISYNGKLIVETPLEYTFNDGEKNIKKTVTVALEFNDFKAHHSEIKSFANGGLMGGFTCDIVFNTWFTYSSPNKFSVDGHSVSFDELGIKGTTFALKNVRFQWIQGVYGKYKWYNMGSSYLQTNPKGDKPGFNGSIYLQLKEMIGDHGSCLKDVEVVKGQGAIFGVNLRIDETSLTVPYELKKYLIEKDEREFRKYNTSNATANASSGALSSSNNSTSNASTRTTSPTKSNSSTPKSNPSNQPSWLNGMSNEQKIAYHKEVAAQRIREVEEYRRQKEADAAEYWRKKRKQEQDAKIRQKELEYARFKRDSDARHKQRKEQRRTLYNEKGGEANYNAKMNQWRTYAKAEIDIINTYLNNYDEIPVKFKYPQSSLEYIILIESIQNAKMLTEALKDNLINNVLEVRNEFFKFDIENGYISNEWDLGLDVLSRDVNQLALSNYLESIAGYKNFRQYGSFSKKFEYIITNTTTNGTSLDNYLLYEGNYKIPHGALPSRPKSQFKNLVKSQSINIQSNQLAKDLNIWYRFHKRPYGHL